MAEGGLKEVFAGVAWSYQSGFGTEKRPKQLNAALHVPLTMDRQDVDTLLDSVRESMDRQIAYYELEQLVEDLAGHITKIKELHTVAAMADETHRIDWEQRGRHGEWGEDKMTAAQQKQLLGVKQNIETWELRAQEIQERIGVLRGRMNGHAAVFSADRDARVPEG